MIVGPQAFGEKAPLQEDIRHLNEELYNVILPVLERKLSRNEYICGSDEFTICDIQLYNEISTILTL